MADTFDVQTRSRIMARVKSENTSLEMRVRRAVHVAGYRYRLHRRDLPGCPDLVLPRYKLAVFVHGCFWHGHQCKRGTRMPASNQDYWMAKIERNKKRDKESYEELKADGWQYCIIWECELNAGTERLLTMLDSIAGKTSR